MPGSTGWASLGVLLRDGRAGVGANVGGGQGELCGCCLLMVSADSPLRRKGWEYKVGSVASSGLLM